MGKVIELIKVLAGLVIVFFMVGSMLSSGQSWNICCPGFIAMCGLALAVEGLFNLIFKK